MAENLASLLIADDEERTREGLKAYIAARAKMFGPIFTAANGDEAMEKIVEHTPSYMVIDIQMPGRNGLAVMREATRAGICPKTIILSGHDRFEYAQEALKCGAADYILKPCHPSEILARLEKLALADAGAEEPPRAEAPGRNRFVDMAAEYIEKNFKTDIQLAKVAEELGISAAYLSTLFTKSLSCSFVDYVNRTRVKTACSYLHDTRLKTYEIAYKVGFNDEKYFTKVFKKVMDMSPTQFRNTQC